MKILFIICGIIICTSVLAQKMELIFGEISTEEMLMQHYEKDKDAKAVVLFDKGKSIFFDTDFGYDIRFTRHKRIKIFDKRESEYSIVSIPLYVDEFGKTEIVKSIEAITYNFTNGSLTQKTLDPTTIYEEKVNERWFVKKFVFPDVQDGSILEYRYILETPFHFNLPDWTFQHKIPTIYSEYEVHKIPFYEYEFLVQGITGFDYQNSELAKEKRKWGVVAQVLNQKFGRGIEFQDYIHTYVLKDVPAFKDEAFISSSKDYMIKMDFQLTKFYDPDGTQTDIISTWPALNEALLKHDLFGKYIKRSERIAKNIVKELPLAGLDHNEKAKTIIQYVKSNYQWNEIYSKYAAQSPNDFINNKSGNAADINLFLIALLNAADIVAQPLIISTRDHGKLHTDYPFDHFTNYVVALVFANPTFLADATDDFLPYYMLPPHCINEKGLIVNKSKEPTWINLSNNVPSLSIKNIAISLDSQTLDAVTEVLIQNTDYESYFNRKKFLNDTIKIKDHFVDKIGRINSIRILGYDNPENPYSMHFQGTYETEKISNTIVISPFLDLPLAKNSLTQKTRTYPVDFLYPWEVQLTSTFTIPKDFVLTELPEKYSLDNELALIDLNYSLNENILTATGNYKFKKAMYIPGEYARIKYYFNLIIEHFNQPIVLEKVN